MITRNIIYIDIYNRERYTVFIRYPYQYLCERSLRSSSSFALRTPSFCRSIWLFFLLISKDYSYSLSFLFSWFITIGGATNGGRVIDPAAYLRMSLDPALKSFTPSHWAYEIVNAILSGDSEFVKLLTTSHAKKWDTKLLVETLGSTGQNLLHVAAFMNRAEIVRYLMESVETEIRTATEQQRTSVRFESVITKTTEDAHTRLVALGKELDKIERVSTRLLLG